MTPHTYVVDYLRMMGYKPSQDKDDVVIHQGKHLIAWERDYDNHMIRVARHHKREAAIADGEGTLTIVSSYAAWDAVKAKFIPGLAAERPAKRICPYTPGDGYKSVDTEDDDEPQAVEPELVQAKPAVVDLVSDDE
jgi:hypothetical protein